MLGSWNSCTNRKYRTASSIRKDVALFPPFDETVFIKGVQTWDDCFRHQDKFSRITSSQKRTCVGEGENVQTYSCSELRISIYNPMCVAARAYHN